jgi:hypothetical protein
MSSWTTADARSSQQVPSQAVPSQAVPSRTGPYAEPPTRPHADPRLDPPTDPRIIVSVPAVLEEQRAGRSGRVGLAVAAAIGSAAAVGLGAYGRMHEPQFVAVNLAGFSSGTAAKAWLASVAFALALVQVATAASMYGRRRPPAVRPAVWVPALHRWSGRVAVLVTVPVAVHCLYALGFQDGSPRVLVHSLLGCFFYGVFVTKMLVLQRPHSPRWALPLLGGALFTAMTAIWLSSAVWFFTTSGLTF